MWCSCQPWIHYIDGGVVSICITSCMIFEAISDCLGGIAMGMLKVSAGIRGVFCISDSISRTECT